MDINLNLFDKSEDSMQKLEKVQKRIDELKIKESFLLKKKDIKCNSRRLTAQWFNHLNEIQIKHPGAPLLEALIHRANISKLTIKEMVAEIGISYAYFDKLRSGEQKVFNISSKLVIDCAKFLNFPRLTILWLTAKITVSDHFETNDIMILKISRAMELICLDVKWEKLFTKELRNSDVASKFAIIKLYEAATGKVLLDNAFDSKSLTSTMAKVSIIRDRRQGILNARSHKNSMSI